MMSVQLVDILIAFLSVVCSLVTVFITLIPYRKKIVFKVSLNPFCEDDKDFKIRFLIINKSERELTLQSLGAQSGLSLQFFKKGTYPNVIKPFSSETFLISNEFLKFDDGLIFTPNGELFKFKNYVSFYFVDSIRKTYKFKVRMKDYKNVETIFKLKKELKDVDLENIPTDKAVEINEKYNRLAKEMLYYSCKNKTKFL